MKEVNIIYLLVIFKDNQDYDVETELFYCKSRYYSPELCRWISPNGIEYLDSQSINGLNLYAYCGNDPLNCFDPTGHSWKSFWNGIGNWFKNIFGAFVDLLYNIVNNGDSFDFIFLDLKLAKEFTKQKLMILSRYRFLQLMLVNGGNFGSIK